MPARSATERRLAPCLSYSSARLDGRKEASILKCSAEREVPWLLKNRREREWNAGRRAWYLGVLPRDTRRSSIPEKARVAF